jgi:hypothetical protein
LKDLRKRDTVTITRTDGTRVAFRVARVVQFPKRAFPSDEVFGSTAKPELRLITCGGDFDFTRHSYRANFVVFLATG